MTAINVTIPPDGKMGIMLTDTAALDADGIVDSFAAKVITLPHMGMVIVSRAQREVGLWAADLVAEFATFDDVVKNVRGTLAEGWPAISEKHPWMGCEIVLLGWSHQSRRIQAYTADAAASFAFVPVPMVYLAPMPEEDALVGAGLLVKGRGIKFGDIPMDLLKIMQLQRAEQMPCCRQDPKRGVGHCIGGAAVLTMVMQGGDIVQRTIHRWPDVVGKRIAA